MSQNPIFSPPYFQHLAIQLSWDTGRGYRAGLSSRPWIYLCHAFSL